MLQKFQALLCGTMGGTNVHCLLGVANKFCSAKQKFPLLKGVLYEACSSLEGLDVVFYFIPFMVSFNF